MQINIYSILKIIIISLLMLPTDKHTENLPECIHIEDPSRTAAVSVYWNAFPEKWREKFIKDNWKLYIMSGTNAIENYYGFDTPVIGATDFNQRTCRIEDNDTALLRAMLHELGHYVDWNSGQILSQTDPIWTEIYQQEKNTLIIHNQEDDHAISTPTEFFAEIVCQGILYPETTSQSAPKAYRYIFNQL